MESAAVAAAEREVRWRARAFLRRRQARLAQYPDHYCQPVVQLQINFEDSPNRRPTMGYGEVAALPTAPRRSLG